MRAAEPRPAATRLVNRAMAWGEVVLYALVGLLLVVSAAVALVATGYNLVQDADEDALSAVAASLDGLLLVFILIELLGAVRATVSERQLLAEPFLIVGMIEIGVLGGVVLLLAVASFLVRRKEREPAEEDG
jgi:uncharacterized membrane protein (DUF373 family)